MSATNKTAVYELPIFLGTDVPSWLTDWNGAMGDIDTAIAAAKAAADAAASTAGTAATDIVTINGQITSLQNTVGTHTTQIGTISGNINTINSLIGNGTPTTTDQTIIGAINELHANQGDLANLTTTDKSSLVRAVNELNADLIKKVGTSASGKTFAEQLTELYAVWQTLSDAHKQRSYLKIGSSIYHIYDILSGVFTNVSANYANIYILYFDLKDAIFYTATGTTVSDSSSATDDKAMELYA